MPMQRRSILHAGWAGAAWLATPRVLFAQAQTPRRFVFVLQRGAADGLDTVVPYADPEYARLRGALAIDPAAALRLDGSFALHPALAQLARLYDGRQALVLHAVASSYRDRSHFDGQNVLETGGVAPYQLKDGWMNRLAGLLPQRSGGAIAFAPTVPPALRGSVDVTSYAPSALPQASDDLLQRVQQMYAGDAQLRTLWTAALDARGMGGMDGEGRRRQDPASLGRMAASFLAQAAGPRIAMMETGGWDTHSGQSGRLAAQLRGLDALLAALREGLGPVWSQTVVLVATEFGRTAAANGTGGTDHGTGSAALLAGGAVEGGRVVSDWPGLAAAALYEGRDLRPTLALEAVVATACAECFGLDRERVLRSLFPHVAGTAVKTVPRLVRA
jgi:uncharacterized protein (DUF1501 family)